MSGRSGVGVKHLGKNALVKVINRLMRLLEMQDDAMLGAARRKNEELIETAKTLRKSVFVRLGTDGQTKTDLTWKNLSEMSGYAFDEMATQYSKRRN